MWICNFDTIDQRSITTNIFQVIQARQSLKCPGAAAAQGQGRFTTIHHRSHQQLQIRWSRNDARCGLDDHHRIPGITDINSLK